MGKSDDTYDYEEPDVPDNSAAIAAMVGAMSQMSAQQGLLMQQMNAANYEMQPPVFESEPNIDWESRRKSLNDEISRDVTKENQKKRGRASTVLTSALDDEEPNIIESVLAGGGNA